MKFKNIELISYGGLINKKIEFGENTNLIFGKNESGKSTIMNAIYNILYGIYPVDREKNKKVNWYNNKLELKANIIIKNQEFEVIRSLNTNVVGTVSSLDKIEKINNGNLKITNDIPKYLYMDLYCLNSKKMINLEENIWNKVDNNLIFSYNDSFIKNPQTVIKEIENDLFGIWRDSNRGKFRLKEIDEEIIKFRNERNVLINKYNELKDVIKKYHTLIHNIESHEIEIKKKVIIKNKIESILPIANIILEINDLKEKYFKFDEYKLISKNIIEKLAIDEEKGKYLEETLENIDSEIEIIKLKFEKYSEIELLIEKDMDVILLMANLYEKIIKEKQEFDENIYFEKSKKKEYKKLYYQIFNKSFSNENFDEFKNINLLNLKINNKINIKKLIISLISIVLGFIFYYNNKIAIALVVASLGLGFLFNTVSMGMGKTNNINGVKINEDSFIKLQKLKDLEYEIISVNEENKRKEEYYKNKFSELSSFFMKYSTTENLDYNVKKIIETSKIINGKRNNDEKNEYFLNQLAENRKNNHEKFIKIENNIKNTNEVLIEFAKGTIQEGINYFTENIKIDSKIELLEEKLNNIENSNVKINEYNELEDEINISSYGVIKNEIAELNDLLNNEKIEEFKLKKTIDDNVNEDIINEIDTKIELLNIEKKELLKEKDNLIFMRELIKLSDMKFKEDNQPDIVRKVNEFFNVFTSGKYDKILLDEISKDIFIKLENFNKDINDDFSKGTTDQLFLALRLALIEHYEKDVKLPIVLDEIFANWDDERIENFIKLLSRISNERQFIILTCKSSVIESFNNSSKLDFDLITMD